MPAANVVTAVRAPALTYGAIANGGEIDGTRFWSRGLVAGLMGRPSLKGDRASWCRCHITWATTACPLGT